MIQLTSAQIATLKHWFLPERPGPLIGFHVINTGLGACWADRWPMPQVVLAEIAGNYALLGDAQALTPADIRPYIKGFVDTSDAFVSLLKAAFPDVKTWPRVVFELQQAPDPFPAGDYLVRRLEPVDASCLSKFGPETAWISKIWGGPSGLAASGFGWGVFVSGQLASVACTGFLGDTFEDIGIVTEPEFRGLGLGPVCALALCDDIKARGHRPSWTTSPNNLASVRVAQKLGFVWQRDDRLFVVGIPIPEPARPPVN